MKKITKDISIEICIDSENGEKCGFWCKFLRSECDGNYCNLFNEDVTFFRCGECLKEFGRK